MSRIMKVITLSVCVMVLGGSAWAEEKPSKGKQAAADKEPGLGPVLKAADSNNDGRVNYGEASAAIPAMNRERFNVLDTNKDGVLTKDDRPGQSPKAIVNEADKNGDKKVTFDELKAVRPKMTQERFNILDTDSDGVLTENDKPASREEAVQSMFQKCDGDKDGKLVLAEFQKAFPNSTEEGFKKMDKNSDGGVTLEEVKGFRLADDESSRPMRMGGNRMRAFGVEKMLESDGNKDGKLTFEELTAAKQNFPREAFDRFDSNKDGVISKDDTPPAPTPKQ